MKWTVYLDASVFWLFVVLLLTGFKDNQTIVYENGILLENITSQNQVPVMDSRQSAAGIDSYEVREITVDPEVVSGGCPYLRCMMETEGNRSTESVYSGTLILLYY